MNGMILTTLQARGQITLPKKYRKELGMVENTHLKVSLSDGKIMIESLEMSDPYTIKPRVSRQVYLKTLKKISNYIEKNGPMWTAEDDRLREVLKKKDAERAKKLDW